MLYQHTSSFPHIPSTIYDKCLLFLSTLCQSKILSLAPSSLDLLYSTRDYHQFVMLIRWPISYIRTAPLFPVDRNVQCQLRLAALIHTWPGMTYPWHRHQVRCHRPDILEQLHLLWNIVPVMYRRPTKLWLWNARGNHTSVTMCRYSKGPALFLRVKPVPESGLYNQQHIAANFQVWLCLKRLANEKHLSSTG